MVRVRSAFALLEVIIGAIVLGVAMASVLSLVGQSVIVQSQGQHMETAARLADERLNLVLAVGPDAYPSVFSLRGPCDEPFEKYAYEVQITPQGGGQAYRVRATVSWIDGTRRPELSLETLIAPRLGDDPDPDRKPPETLNRAAE